MITAVQPAVKSYWFEKGWLDLRDTVKTAWSLNMARVALIRSRRPSGDSFGWTVAKTVFNWSGIVSVLVFGSIVTAVATVLNVLVVIGLMVSVYIAFTLIWVVDRLYLARNRIFTACHHCKKKSLIPTYLCRTCSVEHTHLVPGPYGIIKRTCSGANGSCGSVLPTTFFGGRSSLVARCAHCHEELNSREARPICIPVVGGRSVGKTAFITAFARDFIEEVAPSRSLETELYNNEKGSQYREIQRAYASSDFALTPVTSDSGISSVSFSFFIKGRKLKPDRLMHVYDIAGEVFTQGVEIEHQQQYEYCHGIVLIIDPLSIDTVYRRYESQLSDIDKTRRGAADATTVVDAFINKMREVTGLSVSKIHQVPLAVVVSKIDAIPELRRSLGGEAARTLASSNVDKFKNADDAHDYLCRQLFLANEMRDFLTTVNLRFKTNRFFACSPIGHGAAEGAFEPEGVLRVMEWLIHLADPQLGQRLSPVKFSKETVGQKELV